MNKQYPDVPLLSVNILDYFINRYKIEIPLTGRRNVKHPITFGLAWKKFIRTKYPRESKQIYWLAALIKHYKRRKWYHTKLTGWNLKKFIIVWRRKRNKTN